MCIKSPGCTVYTTYNFICLFYLNNKTGGKKRDWMSNCKTVVQTKKWGEIEKPKEFADYLDLCVVGSWWVGEELKRVHWDSTKRVKLEQKFVKSVFAPFPRKHHATITAPWFCRNFEDWPSSHCLDSSNSWLGASWWRQMQLTCPLNAFLILLPCP